MAEVDRASSAQALHTEIAFALPRGYVDETGTMHREGVMRLATARDEILPQRDPRVRENEAYLTVLLLSRVVTRLGTGPQVTSGTIEGLFASDLAFLQDLFRRFRQEGHSQSPVARDPPSVGGAAASPALRRRAPAHGAQRRVQR